MKSILGENLRDKVVLLREDLNSDVINGKVSMTLKKEYNENTVTIIK